MSIDVNWETATSGPDGEALAERIRSFIHDKFQQVALPRFIRSVQVHSFDFGTIAPEFEIKDFCEPFSDFYEEDEDGEESSDASEELVSEHQSDDRWPPGPPHHHHHSELDEQPPAQFRNHYKMAMNYPQLRVSPGEFRPPSSASLRSPIALGEHLNPHFLPRAGTPGIPGGTSNLGYHLMSLGGLSGTQTPLAAVAGGTPFASGWSDSGLGPGMIPRSERADHVGTQQQQQRPEADVDYSPTSRPSSSANTGPSPPSIRQSGGGGDPNKGNKNTHNEPSHHPNNKQEEPQGGNLDPSSSSATAAAAAAANQLPHPPPRMRERRPEDVQVLCRVKYAGDIRLCLTAEILLDYPMPSFVGLPLKLNVTGVTFDGVAVIAYIRKHVHFCFLSAEDADALVGSDQQHDRNGNGNGNEGQGQGQGRPRASGDHYGGLLREIRVDSEIGRKEDGKQVLKNVGKVERFVLARVRRIFEEELVFPSFWTFLI